MLVTAFHRHAFIKHVSRVPGILIRITSRSAIPSTFVGLICVIGFAWVYYDITQNRFSTKEIALINQQKSLCNDYSVQRLCSAVNIVCHIRQVTSDRLEFRLIQFIIRLLEGSGWKKWKTTSQWTLQVERMRSRNAPNQAKIFRTKKPSVEVETRAIYTNK